MFTDVKGMLPVSGDGYDRETNLGDLASDAIYWKTSQATFLSAQRKVCIIIPVRRSRSHTSR